MFDAVLDPNLKYVWISAPTRYGKSEIIAMACVFLASVFHLKIIIIGLTEKKAKKIMQYVLEHIGDNRIFYEYLINREVIEDAKKLQVMARKTELKWATGGSITIMGTRSTGGDVLAGLSGEGADVVVVEEAGLIKKDDEEIQDMILRMLEPYKGYGKLVLVGNLIENSWFQKAYEDKEFYKIFITLEKAKEDIPEWTDEWLAKQKRKMSTLMWKRMYAMEWVSGSEFGFFKPQRYDLLPPIDKLEIYGAVDLALGTGKSFVGIVILGRHKESGQVFEVESIVEKMTPDEAMNEILNLPYPFVRFGVEKVQFQEYFKQVIERKSKQMGKYIPFVGIKQSKNKQERIESLEPIVNTGQILFKGNNELWQEMKSYPDSEHVDGLDALEMAWRLLSQPKPVLLV